MRWPPFPTRALTRETAIEIADNGLPTTFVPGRNLIFFSFAGALAYRRGARHIVAGMCETDYSGYPDCRDDTVKAMQVALTLGMDKRVTIHTPLMWIDKADDLRHGRENSAAQPLLDLVVEDTHSCYLGDRTQRHDWGYGCGDCPACQLRAQGFAKFMSRRRQHDSERHGKAEEHRRRGFSGPVLPDHSGGQLDDRPCRHGLRAQRPLPAAGGARPDGAVRRADDRRCSGAARPGAATSRRRIRHWRDRRRRCDFGRRWRRRRW